MKKACSMRLLAVSCLLFLSACVPVLEKGLMEKGSREVSFAALRDQAEQHAGKLFVFGGVIVHTKLTQEGAQIEALHVPVDRYGSFENSGLSEGRFLALQPRDGVLLDPVIYRKGRRITLAATFLGTRAGRIDEMDYVYPVFQIQQVHLWPHEKRDPHPPAAYDPWFYPYPYFYRHAWWRHPHRHAPAPTKPAGLPYKKESLTDKPGKHN